MPPVQQGTNRVVHLELQTGNLPRACAFYTRLLGWRVETIHSGGGRYLAVDLGTGIEGGIIECETARPLWVPYVAVESIREATERARRLGATLLLEPREGPAGWRSVLEAPDGAQVALWQRKQ